MIERCTLDGASKVCRRRIQYEITRLDISKHGLAGGSTLK